MTCLMSTRKDEKTWANIDVLDASLLETLGKKRMKADEIGQVKKDQTLRYFKTPVGMKF
jgi:chorismate mutase